MTIKAQLPELWGVAEVASFLGTTSANLDKRAGLPEPVTRVRATRLWQADEIKAYARQRRREAAKIA